METPSEIGGGGGRQRVNLNVGGHKFSTTISTLTRETDSMLARMFSDDWRNKDECKNGECFIDRDGQHFHYILNYLRDGPSVYLPENVITLNELCREAEFYQLEGLSTLLKSKLNLPCRTIKCGEVVRWRNDAIQYYWRPLAIALATEGIEFAFLFDKVGRKYNDKQTVATCFGCCQKFLVDQITVFDYKIRFEEWEALKQHMQFVRGVVVEVIGDTCCVIQWSNHKNLHVPLTAVIPAD